MDQKELLNAATKPAPTPKNRSLLKNGDQSFATPADSTLLESPTNSKLIAVIVFAFLTTFVLARIVVYLTLAEDIPNLFLIIRGVHVHHFTYGVIILALAGLYLLLKRPAAHTELFKFVTILYGVGLGLTFDEFGMWLRLQDNYWTRQSYDAIIIVTLILLNVVYFKWLVFGLSEIVRAIQFVWKKLTA